MASRRAGLPRLRIDWSVLGCGLGGHVVYAPDEGSLRRRLVAESALGPSWRCLRCGDFVPGIEPPRGPADEAPVVRRGAEMRDAFVLRFFAIERWLRAIVLGVAAYVVARFAARQAELRQALDHAPPLTQGIFGPGGFDLQNSKTVHLLREAVNARPSTIRWVIAALSLYALIEVIEGVGLWLLHRWGEYFAFIATGVFVPLEVYELARSATPLKIVTLLLNVGLVVYLAVSKRLFGLHGGRAAYDAERRAESLLEIERAAL
jgi:uncharacterized membrane protein (DUF2068 family)